MSHLYVSPLGGPFCGTTAMTLPSAARLYAVDQAATLTDGSLMNGESCEICLCFILRALQNPGTDAVIRLPAFKQSSPDSTMYSTPHGEPAMPQHAHALLEAAPL